uniref:Uncharacterized protein n=1 Tax=Arundo donax TaxID=35708 RepID=A0A0A8ZYI9_ARUDO
MIGLGHRRQISKNTGETITLNWSNNSILGACPHRVRSLTRTSSRISWYCWKLLHSSRSLGKSSSRPERSSRRVGQGRCRHRSSCTA